VYLKYVHYSVQLADGHFIGITTDKGSLNYSITCQLSSTPEDTAIKWHALRNHIRCMVHIIQLTVGAFRNSLGLRGCTNTWEAHELDQQLGENKSRDIGKSQRRGKEGNARINKVLAMRSGLAKIIEKVRISKYLESPETYLHIVENACSVDYAETWSWKQVHWFSKQQSLHCSTTDDSCEDRLRLDPRVAGVSLPIMRIHSLGNPKSKIQLVPATRYNPGWMGDCQVWDGSFEASPILDPVDVEEVFSHIASGDHNLPWHVRSYGLRSESFHQEQDSVEGRLVLHHEVSSTEAVHLVCWCDSIDRYASHVSTHASSFQEVEIV